MKFRRLSTALLLFGLTLSPASAVQPRTLLTVDPWTALLFRFIGGPFVSVRSLDSWNEKAQLVRDKKLLRDLQAGSAPLVAFDPEQAQSLKLKSPAKENLILLCGRAPLKGIAVEDFYNDPAHLPFAAQKALTVLSRLDPQNYGFYQRRLGEFETRLHSTLFSGRLLLKGAKILDFGGAYRIFFTSVGCQITIPAPEDLEQLTAMMEEKNPKIQKKNAENLSQDERLFLLDHRVDPKLRDFLKTLPNSIEILPPDHSDPLLFLHENFLKVGNTLRKLGRL